MQEINAVEIKRPSFDEEITIEIPKDMPEIKHNLGELKDFALQLKDFYSKLVFSDNNVNEASKEKTKLNKLVNEVKRLRIDNIKKYKEPIESFESTAKEIEKLLNEAKDSVQVFIDKAERQRREDKLEKVITPIINLAINNAFVEGHLIEADKILIDDRWFNKTFKDKDIEEDVNSQVEEIKRQQDEYNKGLEIIKSTIEMAPNLSVEKCYDIYPERYKITKDLTAVLDDIKTHSKRAEISDVDGSVNKTTGTIDNSSMFDVTLDDVIEDKTDLQIENVEFTIKLKGTQKQFNLLKDYIKRLGMEVVVYD